MPLNTWSQEGHSAESGGTCGDGEMGVVGIGMRRGDIGKGRLENMVGVEGDGDSLGLGGKFSIVSCQWPAIQPNKSGHSTQGGLSSHALSDGLSGRIFDRTPGTQSFSA